MRVSTTKGNVCVECKVGNPLYAGNNLCEDCWREMLREKVEEEK